MKNTSGSEEGRKSPLASISKNFHMLPPNNDDQDCGCSLTASHRLWVGQGAAKQGGTGPDSLLKCSRTVTHRVTVMSNRMTN